MRRIDVSARVAAGAIDRVVQSRREIRLIDSKGKRQRLGCRKSARNEIDAVAAVVAVRLQPPVQQTPATVGEHRLHRGGVNGDLAFRCL